MRIAVVVVMLTLAALLASELVLPRVAERKVARGLTERGGVADVSVSAFPALRLLFGGGSGLEIAAGRLDLDLESRTAPFDRLDGFDEVEIAIDDFAAGPFALESLTLARAGEAPYRLVSRGRATPAEVIEFGAGRLGLPGGSLLGGIASGALGRTPVPFTLEVELASDDGAIRVVGGAGTVAGLPAGPIAEMITAAIVARL